MKKHLLYLFLFVFILISCEKDDFCTKETPKTPKLILRFYDNTNPDALKEVELLSVIAQGITDSLFAGEQTDSIAIPLNTEALETVYILKTNTVDGNIINNKIETFTIKYTVEDIFISRACGFKTVFNNLEITSDNGWFISFTPATLTSINNQTNAHIKVYH